MTAAGGQKSCKDASASDRGPDVALVVDGERREDALEDERKSETSDSLSSSVVGAWSLFGASGSRANREVDVTCTLRRPRRCLARAWAFHLAVAFAQIFCFRRTSLSVSASSSSSGPSRCRGGALRISMSCLYLRRIVFRQNRQPMIRKHITKANTRDSVTMSVVFGSLSWGFQPTGRVSRISPTTSVSVMGLDVEDVGAESAA